MRNTSEQNKPLAAGVGRRKEAVARVWLRKGSGNVLVNGKPYLDYFDTDMNRRAVMLPLEVCGLVKNYDIQVNVDGGGMVGQAGAVRLGITRSLLDLDDAFRKTLREYGLVTVDSRKKERKKYGQRGARRKFQFVKR